MAINHTQREMPTGGGNPTAGEIPAIRSAFDRFFQMVETKETDQGVALFNRQTDAEAGSLSTQEVEQAYRDVTDGLKNAPLGEVVQSASELPFAAPDDAKGAFWRGRIYLVADNIVSAQDAREVIAHEMIGHYGLAGFFGSRLVAELEHIHAINPSVRSAAANWRRANQDLISEWRSKYGITDKAVHARSIEEALASMAEKGRVLKGWRRLAAVLQTLLRKMGATKWADSLESRTDAEALLALKKADMFVRRGMTEAMQISDAAYAMFVRKMSASSGTEQIKSATGNNGDFDGRNADIRFSRSQKTQQAYEARIDALFAGEKAAGPNNGVRVLDSSDVLGLLGFGNGPVHLAEGKVLKSQDNHPQMTAEVWKKIPQWLDDPAAVFDSDTVSGRLTMIAPELVNGYLVLMAIEPNASGTQVHILVNAYNKDGGHPPVGRWLREGKGYLVDQKKFPTVLGDSGLQLSSSAWQNKPGMRKILTEKNLAGYRKEQMADGSPKFSRPLSGPQALKDANSLLRLEMRAGIDGNNPRRVMQAARRAVASLQDVRQRPSKAFETLRAAFALQGHSLHRTEQVDRPVSYWTERWGLVRYLPTLHDAPLFLAQIGGRL